MGEAGEGGDGGVRLLKKLLRPSSLYSVAVKALLCSTELPNFVLYQRG